MFHCPRLRLFSVELWILPHSSYVSVLVRYTAGDESNTLTFWLVIFSFLVNLSAVVYGLGQGFGKETVAEPLAGFEVTKPLRFSRP